MRSSDLNTGVTLEVFQLSGNIEVFKIRLKITNSDLPKTMAQSLTRKEGIRPRLAVNLFDNLCAANSISFSISRSMVIGLLNK